MPVIIIFGACHPIGQAAALAFADAGKRVVAVDRDRDALNALCDQNPGWIEALEVADVERDLAGTLKGAWKDQPIEMVLNLLAMSQKPDISGQMRAMSAVVKATLHGLVKGQGSLISLARSANDPLAFVDHGMGSALEGASTALAQAVADKNVKVRCLFVPADSDGFAVKTIRLLGAPVGRALKNIRVEVEVPHKR